jgi:general stress protein 26
MPTKNVDEKEQLSSDAAIAKIRTLLPKFKSAMLVTHTPTGEMHVRPMGLQGDGSIFGGVLWFFVDDRSRKVSESAGSAPVSVICQSDEHSAYLHLTGTATAVRDQVKMRELYSPIIKTWFPDGMEDPHLTLIRFEATGGEYWASPGGTLQVAAAFAFSLLTGRPGKGGEAGNLHLQ